MTVPDNEAQAGLQWGEGAAALCLGVAFAAFAVTQMPAAPEPHPALVVGELTFSGAGKRLDFLFVWLMTAGSLAAYFGIAQVRALISGGTGTAARFREYLVYCCLPAMLWCAQQVLGAPFATPPYGSDLSLIWLSVLLICLTLVASLIWRAGGRRTDVDFAVAVGNAVTAPVLAMFAWIALTVAASRLFLLQDIVTARFVGVGAAITLSAVFAVSLLLLSGRMQVRDQGTAIRRLNLIVQLGLPLAVFALILPPAAGGLPWPRIAPLGAGFVSVLTLLMLAGYACHAMAWRGLESGRSSTAISAASVAAIAVLVLFADGRPTPYGMDNPLDYYHHGEWLIPWQQWSVFGKVPYIDYSPSHGLVDYLSGMANDLLLDGTLAGFPEARQLIRGLCAIAAAFALTRIAGPLPALLALLLFPVTGRYPIFVAIFCGLALLTGRPLQQRPVIWLFAYFLAGTALVLLAPGPGAMLVVAFAPVALVHLVWSAGAAPRSLAVAGAAVAAICGLSMLLGPGKVVVYQIQFMLENRPLYGAVHGLDWARSLAHDWPVNSMFWELIRTLWLPAMLVLLLVAVPRIWQKRRSLRELLTEDPRAVFAAMAALYLFLVIPHTIGRIDAGGPSRGGAMTVFVLALICLPLAAHFPLRSRVASVVGIALVLGMLAPAFDHRLSFRSAFASASATSGALHGGVPLDGPAIGIPALGRTLVSPSLVERVSILKAALDGWLRPEETYLDLSNANAHYFYTGRAVPIESGAFLTLPAAGMQARSVARLVQDPPPVLLLGTLPSGNGPFTVPLRVPVLAEWVFSEIRSGRYQVVQRDPFIFAIDGGRLDGPAPAPTEQTALLRQVFAPPKLARLPSVWGRSFGDSDRAVVLRHVTKPHVEQVGADPAKRAPGSFDIVPGQSRFTIAHEREGAANLLIFELTCSAGKDRQRSVGSGRVIAEHGGYLEFDLQPGAHIVPLDADPMTLLQASVEGFRLELALDQHCGAGIVGGFRLAARAGPHGDGQ